MENDKIHFAKCGKKEADFIQDKLRTYNRRYITDYQDFVYFLKSDSGKIYGGIAASKDNQRMTVDYLWVDEPVRSQGYGTKLLKHIENIARENKCTLVWLSTFGFQAPDFYIKNGYEVFGVLEKCISGYSQFFFKKSL
jgi:GNAT superfamily N-acetyltransferase